MRKLSPIASFSAVSAPQPHLAAQDPRSTVPFLFRTNKPHKINILPRALLKTKEKQFSIQYKFAVGSIGNLACAHLISLECGSNAKIQFRRAQARFPMFVARVAGNGSRSTNHDSRITSNKSRSQSRRVQVLCGVGGCSNVCITTQYCSVFSRNAVICSAVAPGAAM